MLAALTIFLEGDGVKIDRDDGCLFGDPSRVRITCEFTDWPEKMVLDSQFQTTLKQERVLTSTGRLRITKMFDCTATKVKSPTIFIHADDHPVDEAGASLLPLTLPQLKAAASSFGVELEAGEATVKAKIREAITARSKDFTHASVDIPIGANDAKAIWEQLLAALPVCALFISDRSSNDKDKEAQSPLAVAVELAISEIQDELSTLSKQVQERVTQVADRTREKLAEMNPDLAGELKPVLRDQPKWKDMFKYSLMSDGGVPWDKRGSGVRRMMLLSFFRAEAERKAADEGGRDVIYAVEEPETSQHPDHQKMLVRALLEIAEAGGQVVVTTHAPGLAGEVPANSIRFLDQEESVCLVRDSASDVPSELFPAIAERLGMLPDNHVKVMVCLEGKNDCRFLTEVSRTLHGNDSALPDLSVDPRFLLIPMHGGNLKHIVDQNLFRNLRKPEFHLYDRDDNETYAEEVANIEGRDDGSVAKQTNKRYMESYIHPAAVERVTGIAVEINDSDDYIPGLANQLNERASRLKHKLNSEIAAAMTVDEIDARDSDGEIRHWLTELADLAN